MLFLSFLWHMHQPWYLDPRTRRFVLPWVRLHAAKDYLDMALLIQEFPAIHSVVNFTPVLLSQLELYGEGVLDEHQLLCAQNAESLTESDAENLSATSFSANPQTMITPYPRYSELMAKSERKQKFSAQELRDLQVWSNLAWMDPRWRREIPECESLFLQGEHFTEEQKNSLLHIQQDLIRRVIPTYRTLQDTGQLELTTTPWAHPILPLLFNTDVMRQTNPQMSGPRESFRFPDDVRWHLDQAVSEHVRRFGKPPAGLWPSEGSVSDGILPLIAEAGLSWLATDEGILWKSLQQSHPKGFTEHSYLHRPYRVDRNGKPLVIVFRDQTLSDLIGFVYQSWEAQAAADDFVNRLREIEKGSSEPAFVLVALDGENAWESYPGDGEPFLRALYGALSKEPSLRCCTVSEYLRSSPPCGSLESLAAGSWIRGEFSTWIGHPPQNRAWEELARVRQIIGPSHSQSVAIAEGSDWFWWFGPEHNSSQDSIFDQLFRENLKAAYQAAGAASPASLEEPIKHPGSLEVSPPIDFIHPVIDGEITSYFEWLQAAHMDLKENRSSTARAANSFSRLWWGNDSKFLYFRLDPAVTLKKIAGQLVIQEARFEISCAVNEGTVQTASAHGKIELPEVPIQVSAGKIIEIAIPFATLGIDFDQPLHIVISIREEEHLLERYPADGVLFLPFLAERTKTDLWSA